MKKRYILLTIAAFLCTLAMQPIQAQKEMKKQTKVVVVKKTIDKDGNETVEKIVSGGKDIDDLLKEMNIHMDVDIQENGQHKKVIIKKIVNGGEPQIIEWEGDGEIPGDILIHIEECEDGAEEGAAKIIFMEENIGETIMDEEERPFLGVLLGLKKEVTNENGVISESISHDLSLMDVIENSPAEKAGLQSGDILLSLDNYQLENYSDLKESMSNFEVGDVITVKYDRNGKDMTTELTLASSNNFSHKAHKIWKFKDGDVKRIIGHHSVIIDEEVIENEDGKKIVRIIKFGDGLHQVKHKIIIIKKAKKNDDGETVDEEPEVEISVDPNYQMNLDEFNLYPNPTAGEINVSFRAAAEPIDISITDISGREIFKKSIESFSGYFSETIEVKDAAKGILILTLRQGNKVFAESIMYQ